ncbi:unnamed protein product, partial [Callosobruchus maculatus]
KHLLAILAFFVLKEVVQSATTGHQAHSSKVGSVFLNEIEEGWIEQPVDHFNSSDGRLWKQRYFVNQQYAKPTRDVALLIISGETEASVDLMLVGEVVENAKNLGAVIFQLE